MWLPRPNWSKILLGGLLIDLRHNFVLAWCSPTLCPFGCLLFKVGWWFISKKKLATIICFDLKLCQGQGLRFEGLMIVCVALRWRTALTESKNKKSLTLRDGVLGSNPWPLRKQIYFIKLVLLELFRMSRSDAVMNPFIFLLICNRPKHSFYINLESWLH